MSVAQYTDQPYKGTEGKVLLADRAYLATTATAAPTAKQAGATPSSWTDIGSIEDSLVTIEKGDPDILEVTTGLYQVLRAQIVRKDGVAKATFTIVEYEPSVWASLTGDSTHVIGTGGVGIWVGGRPIIQKALLLLGYNPVTGAEFHHYSPKVDLTYKITETNRFRTIQVTATFLKYVPAGDTPALSRDFELIYWT